MIHTCHICFQPLYILLYDALHMGVTQLHINAQLILTHSFESQKSENASHVSVCVCVHLLAARTRDVMKEFGDVYEQQYVVALFNSVRFEIEAGGGGQSQLLHRKASRTCRLYIKQEVHTSRDALRYNPSLLVVD